MIPGRSAVSNHRRQIQENFIAVAIVFAAVVFVAPCTPAQSDDEYESIDSSACATCHEESSHGTQFEDDLSHSAHAGFLCLDCHTDRDTVPHRELGGCRQCEACSGCHDD
jgi:hypothetical protein